MKGGILFTGTGPIVVLTSYDGFTDPNFIEKMNAKGVKRFMAYDVPVEELKDVYGNHFNVVRNDLHQTDDLRVLDYDGHRILSLFKISKLGEPSYHEL